MTEQERRENFQKVLRRRRSNIIEQIQKLTNLKNKAHYDYSDGEMETTLKLIKTTLKTTEKILKEK